jgi:hypothetical protein
MLPKNEWWAVIAAYNDRIFPLQWIGVGIMIILTLYLMFGEEKKANIGLKIFLGSVNLWIAIGFFFMSEGFPLPLRISQGSLFVVIGILTLVDIKRKRFVFQFPKEGLSKVFFLVSMFFMLLYPFVGGMQGKAMSYWIMQGTLPCPTTAFFLILIITAKKREGRLLHILLLFWAIPFPPLVQIPKYGVYEDGIMFLIGLVGLGILISDLIKNSKRTKMLEV